LRSLAELALVAVGLAAAVSVAAELAPLGFEPPAPGTYSLPVVDRVRDHPVVDSSGEETSLFALKEGRLGVVAFVYTSCPETEGCPLAQAVLLRLDRSIAEDAALAPHVALVSLSFDPERDTPEKLARFRELQRPKSEWRFATARKGRELAHLLDDFNQTVTPIHDDDGRFTGVYRHVLKVFLLDEENRVRNVYSSDFLLPELVLNDLKTLREDS
jgi:cytochrome c peroxidase